MATAGYRWVLMRSGVPLDPRMEWVVASERDGDAEVWATVPCLH